MEKVFDFVTNMNEKIGKAASYLLYPGMIILVIEVIMRYVFGSPTIWVHGYTQRIFGSYFILIGAHTLLRGGHVRVDLLYNRLKYRARLLLDILNYVLLIIWTSVLLVGGWNFFMYSFKLRQTDEMVLAHPIYPVKFLLVVGIFLIFIQGIVYLIQNISKLVKRKEENYEHGTDNNSSNV